MIEVSISKDADWGGSGKSFSLDKGEIEIIHDTEDGKDIVRVTINGKIEFEYDVNNPDEEIVGYFTSKEEWKEIKKYMTEEQIRNIAYA